MNFLNGMKDGREIEYYEDGNKKLESEFKNNKETGVWIVYFKNGKISTTFSYLDGQLNGPVTIYDEKGIKIVDGNYKDGKEDGKWLFYDIKGKVKKEENYIMGKNSKIGG